MSSIAQVRLSGDEIPTDLPRFGLKAVALFSFAALAAHLLTNHRYGYFRDELYYLDCARHLASGYVDMAPLAAFYARFGIALGGSLFALRLLPAIANALTVLVTMLVARELGGGLFAQALAGLCALLAPALLAVGSIMTMNAFEPLYWTVCIWLVYRIARTGNSRLWVLFGVVAGIAIENKHSAVFFLAALLIAVLLTPLRAEFRSRWIWSGILCTLLLALPNAVWQVLHHFPTYEDLRNVQRLNKNVVLGPGEFFWQQIGSFNPVAFLVWGAGLIWCFLEKQWRVLAIAYVALYLIFVALHAKNYYFFPIHPMLIAAGAVFWERFTATTSRTWMRIGLMTVVSISGVLLLPFSLPILSAAQFVAYEHRLHITPPKAEVAHVGPLPQPYGDQFGWPELVAEVASDYDALPASERERTWIFANNYGEAGAIDFFGPGYGLPQAISAHQNHFFWGPPAPPIGVQGSNLIVLQDSRKSLARLCDNVTLLSEHHSDWGMAEENAPIYLCQGLKTSLQDLWPKLKHWN